MIYTKAYIYSGGVPVSGALISVSDRSGKTITRNDTQIIRESDEDGYFIIPVLESDFITIAKNGYAPVTIQVDESLTKISLQPSMARQSAKESFTNMLRFFGLVAPLVSILFMVYQFHLLNKKS